MRGNASIPPFSLARLRDHLNNQFLSLPNSNQNDRFKPGFYECAVEFLQKILVNIDFDGNTVYFPVTATCNQCVNNVVHCL